MRYRFVYASRSHAPDLVIRYENGTVTGGYRIIADHLGSPRLVVDANSGAVALRRTYDAFGRVLDSEGSLALVFGYAGGLYDPLTGLVRFGARDYDAETGRWTAKDPIGFAGGDPALYGYVLGDPVNFVDPEGEESVEFAEPKGEECWEVGGVQFCVGGGRNPKPPKDPTAPLTPPGKPKPKSPVKEAVDYVRPMCFVIFRW